MRHGLRVPSSCAMVACLALLTGCFGGGGDDDGGGGGVGTYTEPASIWAAFVSGTPNPPDREDFTPTEFEGRLCPPESIEVLNHDPNRTEAPTDNLWIVNSCADTVTLYMCAVKGSLTQPAGGLEQCATDPLDTPLVSFTTVAIMNGPYGVWYPSTGNLTVQIYYCSSGETFVAPPFSDYVACLAP
jgi:hypothetical protein